MNRRGLIITVLILVVLLGGLLYWKRHSTNATGPSSSLSSADLRPHEVLVKGTIECLPYKATSPSIDQECVKGIRGSDGKIYALDSTLVNGREELMSVGTPVQAIGIYTPAAAGSEELGVWNYDGVLQVRILNTG
jgi:hypothetical protein